MYKLLSTDRITSPKVINGISLANYLPERGSCNSVVYVHKRCFEKPKLKRQKIKPKEIIETKEFKNKNHHKSQQFNSNKDIKLYKNKTHVVGHNNEDSVLEQTIRIAKNIVPLVLPPSDNKVIYTIKTAKKHEKKDKRPRASSIEKYISNSKEESKKIIETYKKVKKESINVNESFSHSLDNTLDDLNINHSLCCTFSEMSENKYKINKCESKKLHQRKKFIISESFEAVATENTGGDGKIKIQLMNEQDKHYLSDRIKEPILNAIRDYISELHSNKSATDVTTMHKLVNCNAEKLDNILDKLTCIEEKLDDQQKRLDKFETQIDSHEKVLGMHAEKLNYHDKKINNYEKKLKLYVNELDKTTENRDQPKKPKVQKLKPQAQASVLEELSENLMEIKEYDSSEEELHCEILDRRSKSTVIEEMEQEKNTENVGDGEVPCSAKRMPLMGVKLERCNRIPARFCWTDAGKNK